MVLCWVLGACVKRKTLCVNFELRLTPTLRRNGLKIMLECYENSVNESLISFSLVLVACVRIRTLGVNIELNLT